jgi:hypothetical protein
MEGVREPRLGRICGAKGKIKRMEKIEKRGAI